MCTVFWYKFNLLPFSSCWAQEGNTTQTEQQIAWRVFPSGNNTDQFFNTASQFYLSCVHKLCLSFRVPLLTSDAHKNTQTCEHSLAFKSEILPWTKEHFSRDSHLRFKAGDHTTFPGVNVSLIVFIWRPSDIATVKLHHVTLNCELDMLMYANIKPWIQRVAF